MKTRFRRANRIYAPRTSLNVGISVVMMKVVENVQVEEQ